MERIYFQTAFQKSEIQGVQSVWSCDVSRMMLSIPGGNKREHVRFRGWPEPRREKGAKSQVVVGNLLQKGLTVTTKAL